MAARRQSLARLTSRLFEMVSLTSAVLGVAAAATAGGPETPAAQTLCGCNAIKPGTPTLCDGNTKCPPTLSCDPSKTCYKDPNGENYCNQTYCG